MEDTLTAGYARALALEAERLRLERRINSVAAELSDGGDRNDELAELSRRASEADGALPACASCSTPCVSEPASCEPPPPSSDVRPRGSQAEGRARRQRAGKPRFSGPLLSRAQRGTPKNQIENRIQTIPDRTAYTAA